MLLLGKRPVPKAAPPPKKGRGRAPNPQVELLTETTLIEGEFHHHIGIALDDKLISSIRAIY